MCPVSGYQGGQISTSLSMSPPQEAAESSELLSPSFSPVLESSSAPHRMFIPASATCSVGLIWANSNTGMSLNCVSQTCTPSSSWGCTSPEHSRRSPLWPVPIRKCREETLAACKIWKWRNETSVGLSQHLWEG